MHNLTELCRADRNRGYRKKLSARLEWLEQYQDKEFSVLAAIEKGRKLPDWVEQEPYLEPAEQWLLDAYFDLSTCRGIDGNIPWRDMLAYAHHAGLEPDVERAFVKIMRSVDRDKLERHRAKSSTPGIEGITPRAENALGVVDDNIKAQTATKETMRAMARHRVKFGKHGRGK